MATTSKRTASKKTTAKKTATRKPATKKSATKKPAAKKATAEKQAPETPPSKKPPRKKPPLWKQAFDAVERPVANLSEQVTHSEAFADNMARAVRSSSSATRRLPVVPRTPDQIAGWLGKQLDRGLHRTRNGLKVLTGFDAPPLATSPHTVVWERDRAQLRRYDSTQRRHETPLLLVMSLVSTSKLFDLRPHNSFVAYLLQAGFDVYLLDWGLADERDAANDLATYVDHYIVGAVEAISELIGEEQVDVVGYCFGGDLALLHAASYPDSVRRLCVIAT
ncbi:alpha/beta fold hydrolase, partial [Ilumatobacter sp.]|uniref:alpha/beta fold hydrolase n=1 Tax=Ilumatobacter sp. TaxID=1967498 RepID=UPI003C66AD4E